MTDTRDTPEAALERHHDCGGFCGYCSSELAFEPWPCDAARAREEIARLRAALRRIGGSSRTEGGRCVFCGKSDPAMFHDDGCPFELARAALAASEP